MSRDWNNTDSCNVAGALAEQARTQADAAAIHWPSGIRGGRVNYTSSSYAQLDGLSDTYARGLLEYGIRRGTRVALMVPPGLEFFALFFALFKAGVVPVLIDPGIGLKSLKTCLQEAAPEAFIGVTRAHLARKVLRWAPGSINKSVTIGTRLGWGGIDAKQLSALGERTSGPVLARTRPGEMAAILFTSGSTGSPKGVVYRHRHFVAQVDMLRKAFDIRQGEVDLPTFPPFALFDPALGMTTVVPHMDPTRPARANPAYLVQAIEEFGVTNIFGSPALLKVLSRYTETNKLRLPSLKRVIAAGAAVPLDTVRRMQNALDGEAAVFTPYGSTECLPVATLSSREITGRIEADTLAGDGICVGTPVTPNLVRVISINDRELELLEDEDFLPPGVSGEIIVSGPTTTDAYWRRETQTRLAKSTDLAGRLWHRMGDIGYLDEKGLLWYCGRKSQRVRLGDETLFPDQLEAIFNQHPAVERTALVGVANEGSCLPVLCVELSSKPGGKPGRRRRQQIRTDLLQMAASKPHTHAIQTVLFHRGFPVDIRHNAKIGRESLAKWAGRHIARRRTFKRSVLFDLKKLVSK